MSDQRKFIINEIVKYSQKLDQKGFGANHDGNISAKFEGVLLATPTAVSKGNITDDMIITLDASGNKIEGSGKPFSEIKLHLVAYNVRQDVNAVVHAHPPFATARGLVNLPLRPSIPEAIVSLGDIIPVIPFVMPGAKENDSIIANALSGANAFFMPGNGVLAVGTCVEQAYLRLELVEHLAKIDYYASHMGMPMLLTNEEISLLLEKRAAAGLDPAKSSITAVPASKQHSQVDEIKRLIIEEIKKVL
jgi:L-fuculose-phosphate aldolase